MSKKKSQNRKSIPKKNTGKLILTVVLLGSALVIGGKYIIQERAR